MKTLNIPKVALMVITPILAMTVFAIAQQGQGRGGRKYDPATETTVTGKIEEVKQIPGPGGGPGGVHLLIISSQGKVEAQLGPARFIEKQEFKFAKGDQVEIVGSKVKGAEVETVIAREIKKDGKVLTLRNAQGIPVWSRGRQ